MEKNVLYSFKKSESEEIRLSAGSYREKIYVDLRLFFKDPGTGEIRPTKKGLTLPVHLVRELVKAVECLDPDVLEAMEVDGA